MCGVQELTILRDITNAIGRRLLCDDLLYAVVSYPDGDILETCRLGLPVGWRPSKSSIDRRAAHI